MDKTQINKFLTWQANSKTTVTSIRDGMWSKLSISLRIVVLFNWSQFNLINPKLLLHCSYVATLVPR